MDKRLLTIQDISCVGQCSLTVALPVISACGIETAILPSSVLSNHTAGFSAWTFRDLTDEMPNILDRWKKENVDFDAFYTGYVSKAQIPHILDIMNQVARPGALRIVDPVMGDNGKLYAGFDDDFPMEMRKLVNGADIILPNMTEAALLLGIPYQAGIYTQEYIEKVLKEDAADSNNIKAVYIESPANPLLTVTDIEEVSELAKIYNKKVIVDNTFLTPYLQRPLSLGADIVIHSGTKYLGGHSDTVSGFVVVNDKEIADRLYYLQNAIGGVLGPWDSYLMIRGIKTLGVRMDRHVQNAEKVAEWLVSSGYVDKVYYPGLKSDLLYS